MQTQKHKIDFGWGNPYFLLDVLSNLYNPVNVVSIKELIYGPYEGSAKLIEQTRQVIKETTGNSYDHVLIVNGASSGLNLLLRKFKKDGGAIVRTSQYGYPSYEDMIKRAGLERKRSLNIGELTPELQLPQGLTMSLIDSPENPTGEQFTGGNSFTDIWDAVYHNKIYTDKLSLQPRHKYFIGSYSKLLGVAGTRVGYIATNDHLAYLSLLDQSHNESCGVSKPSQNLISNILKNINLDVFMSKGNTSLCYNKEEFSKLEYLFDGQPVNESGMFYSPKASKKAIELLDWCGVGYVKLDEETIRLSLGQTNKITKEGIQYILRRDKK